MKSDTKSSHQESLLNRILLRLGARFTSPVALVGLPILLTAAVVSLGFLVPRPAPEPVTEIIPGTSSPTSTAELNQPTAHPTLTPTIQPTLTASPTGTPSTTPTTSLLASLPSSALVEGVDGHRQSMPLSCEARSAVDWAAYFGVEIDEKAFFDGLPVSDNPEKGFVGDVQGSWGQIPPEDYGVHAKPIAQRLREYGLQAKAIRHLPLDELKAEIAAGRPVIIWVVGHVNRGTPVPYTTTDGETTIVAEFEHTVIVTGYTEHKLTVVDGARVYSIYQGEFLKSWNVLENQAVVWIE